MKTEKIRGNQAMDLEIANITWTVGEWQKWALRNNVGLILEDGRVVGWDEEPKRWHK